MPSPRKTSGPACPVVQGRRTAAELGRRRYVKSVAVFGSESGSIGARDCHTVCLLPRAGSLYLPTHLRVNVSALQRNCVPTQRFGECVCSFSFLISPLGTFAAVRPPPPSPCTSYPTRAGAWCSVGAAPVRRSRTSRQVSGLSHARALAPTGPPASCHRRAFRDPGRGQ